jgi:hypothetical protein
VYRIPAGQLGVSKLKVEAEAYPKDVIYEQSREKDNGSQERIELEHSK